MSDVNAEARATHAADVLRGTTVGARSWHGLWILLIVLGVRCTVSPDPFPGWSGDPLVVESPITGLTPAFSVGLDVVTLLASAVVLAGCTVRGWRPRVWGLALYTLGGASVAWYSVRGSATLGNIVLGCQWLAAFGSAVACVQACRDAGARRMVVAALMGVALTAALKGGYQVFVEHAAMYQDFVRNKAQVLAAQGWSEGSPMALAYERRLSQADASGWFGLSNVFATVMAAGMTVCVGVGAIGLIGRMGHIGRMKTGVAAGLLVAGAVFAGGVWLSHSKGGFAAAAMGLGLLVAGWVLLTVRWRLSAGAVGAVVAVLPLAALVAVVLRGMVGERWSELSLYFRWFYLEGAARVIAESPLLGVGPDGFKEAYLRLKPALSPEEVSSPHSWYVDLIATLGVGGWAWACWVVVRLWRAGTGVVGIAEWHAPTVGRGTPEGRGTRDEVRVLLVVFGVVTAASALFEHRIASVEGTLLRVVSLVGAVVVGALVTVAMKGWERRIDDGVTTPGAAVALRNVPLVAALVAAVTHCQIEMTGITAGAGMWVLLLLAVCAGAGLAQDPARVGSSRTIRGRVGAGIMAGAAIIPGLALTKLVPWERHIRGATRIVEPVPVFAERAGAMASGRAYAGDSIDRLARDLSATLGRQVPATPAGISAAIEQARMAAVDLASRELLKARNEGPWDFQTARALSRLRLILALAEPDQARVLEQAPLAESAVRSHMEATGASASGWAWIGTMRRTVWERTGGRAEGRNAVEAFARAAALSPYEPMYRVEAARLEATMGEAESASRWAAEALRLSENMRLDPVRQLAGAELEEMRRLAGWGR